MRTPGSLGLGMASVRQDEGPAAAMREGKRKGRRERERMFCWVGVGYFMVLESKEVMEGREEREERRGVNTHLTHPPIHRPTSLDRPIHTDPRFTKLPATSSPSPVYRLSSKPYEPRTNPTLLLFMIA